MDIYTLFYIVFYGFIIRGVYLVIRHDAIEDYKRKYRENK